MCGGHFDYKQHRLTDIKNDLDLIIKNNKQKSEWGGLLYDFSPDIIDKFKQVSRLLEECAAKTHAIDYLVSGDTDENTFIKEWQKIERKFN